MSDTTPATSTVSTVSSAASAVPRVNVSTEICILAGGLSKRMGRDKSGLPLGTTTMLGAIRKAARATGLPVRVIRRDLIPKCGPLSGIYTALKTTHAVAVLFLACDMPFVTSEFIRFLLEHGSAFPPRSSKQVGRALRPARVAPLAETQSPAPALFARSRGRAGFPFLLSSQVLKTVHRQIENGDFSLQSLAKVLGATILTLKQPWTRQLSNINTPKDWARLQARLACS